METDFCVVGGGPAGLTIALLLLRSGARVTLVERHRPGSREFRGEILQPGGMALLDQLGVLAGAKAKGCFRLDRFQLVDRGRPLLDIDYRRLPAPYDHLLSLPQEHLLDELLAQCAGEEGFTCLMPAHAKELIRESGRIAGVVCAGAEGRTDVLAHCVIAADGRYSKVRRLAGIDNLRAEAFDLDVLWFKVPLAGGREPNVRIFRGRGNPVLAYPSYPDQLQLGWTLPHGSYGEFVRRGLGPVLDEVCAAVPRYAETIRARITDRRRLSLLDVFAARARSWALDGLLLIGDSAHTHSPIGAQGINLAIQDAVVAHPILMESLRQGDASRAFLDRYTRLRGPDIDAVMKMQVMQSKGMLSRGRRGAVARQVMARILPHTPVLDRITRRIALGNPGIRVATDHLVVNR